MNPKELDALMASHGWFQSELYNSPIALYYWAENVSTDKTLMINLLTLAGVQVSGNTEDIYIRIALW